MDPRNHFHTDRSFALVRLEHVALVLALSLLALRHLGEIRWPLFVVTFAAIDLIGYLPGAIAWRRARGRKIAPLYYLLYNLTHSYLTGAAAVGAWALVAGRLEWAMLAIPIHLSGDRGLFGNTYKAASLPFEAA